MKKGQFAFWYYDLFPYVLGGKIASVGKPTKAHDRHRGIRPGTIVRYVAVASYSANFLPRHIMPGKAGEKVRQDLEDLREEYRLAQQRLNHEYMSKALDVAPFLQNFPNYSDFLPARKPR